jgi:hypothetical protein
MTSIHKDTDPRRCHLRSVRVWLQSPSGAIRLANSLPYAFQASFFSRHGPKISLAETSDAGHLAPDR